MTRLLTRLGGLAAILAATTLPAAAQMHTERVRLRSGTSEVTRTRVLHHGQSARYLVRLSAGQVLVAHAGNATAADAVDPDAADCFVQVFMPGSPLREGYGAPNDSGQRDPISDWTARISRGGVYQVLLINAGPRGTCLIQVGSHPDV